MKGLDEDIKNGRFSRVYLLYGSEDYLRSLYRKKLSAAICDPGDTMNVSRFEGSSINIPGLIDTAETMPFFSERRLIVVSDSSFFSSSCDELADYLSSPCPSTYFIFEESKVDKRTRMYKAVSKLGRCVELNPPDTKTLTAWSKKRLKDCGKSIRDNTLIHLFERSGTDMFTLAGELDKLADYTGERTMIEDEDVDAICTVELKNRIFEMLDAATEHRLKQAFELYYELLSQKVSPYMIMAMLFRQFNIMLQVKEMSSSTRNPNDIAGRIGQKPFVVKKSMALASSYSTSFLRSLLNATLSMEQEAKSGRMDDTLAIELMLYSIGRKRKAGTG